MLNLRYNLKINCILFAIQHISLPCKIIIVFSVVMCLTDLFRKLVVVSDCLSVIQRVNSSNVDRGPAGVVIQDIKHIATQFDEISFSHVLRQYNVAAHTLARSAEHFISTVFRNFAPDCIRQTLCYDLWWSIKYFLTLKKKGIRDIKASFFFITWNRALLLS